MSLVLTGSDRNPVTPVLGYASVALVFQHVTRRDDHKASPRNPVQRSIPRRTAMCYWLTLVCRSPRLLYCSHSPASDRLTSTLQSTGVLAQAGRICGHKLTNFSQLPFKFC